MGVGKTPGVPITPYAGSWAATVNTDPVPAPPVPVIMANLERRRVFLIEHPGVTLLGPEEVAAAWARFVRHWDDGVVRLPIKNPEG